MDQSVKNRTSGMFGNAEMAAAGLVIVGCLLRAVQFRSGAFPWPGELSLYRMMELGWSELLFNPLDFSQFKAPGFLAATKVAHAVFEPVDVGLRVVPFACSLVGVYLAWLIARRLVVGVWLVVFVGLFALNPIFILYASAPASFPVDLLVALALLLSVLWLMERDFQPFAIAVTATVGAAGLFFSHYALVSLVGMWVAIGLMVQERPEPQRIRAWVAVGCAWFIIAVGSTALGSPELEPEVAEPPSLAERPGVRGV